MMKKLFILASVFILFHAALFAGAAIRLDSRSREYYSGNKVHFAAFFCLSLLASLIFVNDRLGVRIPFILSVVYSVMVAAALELMQRFLGYRTFSETDILWGFAGAASYAAAARLFLLTKPGRQLFSWFY